MINDNILQQHQYRHYSYKHKFSVMVLNNQTWLNYWEKKNKNTSNVNSYSYRLLFAVNQRIQSLTLEVLYCNSCNTLGNHSLLFT